MCLEFFSINEKNEEDLFLFSGPLPLVLYGRCTVLPDIFRKNSANKHMPCIVAFLTKNSVINEEHFW